MVTAFGATNRGRRDLNEDYFQIAHDDGLFIVADGMGGHQAGELASRIAVETMMAFLGKTRTSDDFTWPFGIDPRLTYNGNRLITAVRLANRRVFRESEGRAEYTGMGTTVVAALVDGDCMSYASVGDSRIYSLAGGKLVQLTRDDSWVAALRQEGVNEAALAAHPMRHVLTNAIGAREQTEVQLLERRLVHGERILLCTDGVHDSLAHRVIESILSDCHDVQVAAECLVREAFERGGADNITALVLRYCGQPDDGAAAAAGSDL